MKLYLQSLWFKQNLVRLLEDISICGPKLTFNYIRQSIQSLCEEFVSSFVVTTPVSTLWNRFSQICNHCLNLIPSKWSTTKHNQPWITRHIKQLSRKKQRAYNHARLTNHTTDWSTYLDLKDSLNVSAV